MGPYASSKFALEAFSDSLRRELWRHGVKVSVIEPGAIQTPIWEKGMADGLAKAVQYPPEIDEVYGPALENFERRLREVARKAEPVRLVTSAVEHALGATKPRVRYPVGRRMRLSSWLSRVLPEGVLDRWLR